MTQHLSDGSTGRRSRSTAPALVSVSAIVGAMIALGAIVLPDPGGAAEVCQSGACTACDPAIPGAVSIYIPTSAFPGGFFAHDPIAFIDPADGLRHRFVATRQGAILVWNTQTHAFNATPFLDLRNDGGGPGLDKVLNSEGSQLGLLSVAFDPDYSTTGRFWVFYSSRAQPLHGVVSGDIVVEGYLRSGGNPEIASTAESFNFHIPHGTAYHPGGHLAFGPDGYLYISTGDGNQNCDGQAGTGGDAQLTTSLLGKVLRIDVRGIAPSPAAPECGLDPSNYAVPNNNPYVGGDGCNEVWLLGLRYPLRFSFDRQNGDLFIGDIGQENYQEINVRAASRVAPTNFGWPCREGCDNSSTPPSSCSIPGCPIDPGTTCTYPTRGSGFTDPMLCNANPVPVDRAIGGYRYRGTLVPSLAGRYIYSTNGARIWVTTSLDTGDPGATRSCCWRSVSNSYGVGGFAEDRLGEIYVIHSGDASIYCVHNGSGCPWADWADLFKDGFESGNTDEWGPVVP